MITRRAYKSEKRGRGRPKGSYGKHVKTGEGKRVKAGEGKKRGRPKGSYGKHVKTIVREQIIQDCKALAESRALRLTSRILDEEAHLAFSDIREIFDENGEVLPPHKLPDEVARAVQSVRRIERTVPRKDDDPITIVTFEYKFWDKSSALERLSRHVGLYKADNEQKPSTRINLQKIDINLLKKFSDNELQVLAKLGMQLNDDNVALPDVIDIGREQNECCETIIDQTNHPVS